MSFPLTRSSYFSSEKLKFAILLGTSRMVRISSRRALVIWMVNFNAESTSPFVFSSLLTVVNHVLAFWVLRILLPHHFSLCCPYTIRSGPITLLIEHQYPRRCYPLHQGMSVCGTNFVIITWWECLGNQYLLLNQPQFCGPLPIPTFPYSNGRIWVEDLLLPDVIISLTLVRTICFSTAFQTLDCIKCISSQREEHSGTFPKPDHGAEMQSEFTHRMLANNFLGPFNGRFGDGLFL